MDNVRRSYILSHLPNISQRTQGNPVRATQNQEKELSFLRQRTCRSSQDTLEPPLPPYFKPSSPRMIFVFKSSNPKETTFDADKLKTVCAMETDILSASYYFTQYCYNRTIDEKNGIEQCYSSWSLGNYVALLNNRKSCQDMVIF